MSIRQQSSPLFVNGSGAVTLAFPAACVAGNTIVAVLTGYNGGGSVSATFTDDKSGSSNSYSNSSSTDAAARVIFGIAINIGVAQTITLTPGGSINGFLHLLEIDNIPTSSIHAATAVFLTDADSTPALTLTSGSPSQATNIVIVAACSREDFGVTFAMTDPSSGYTRLLLDIATVGAFISASIATKSGSGSAQTATWSHNTGAPGAAGMLVLKQNAGGSAVPAIVLNYLR